MPEVISLPIVAEKAVSEHISSEENKKPKPCCACPETRRARDECIIEKGPDMCEALIEAHRKCMRQFGFEV
ncbi:unnamed protein product [Soboliphyme baturini]|uniref:Cytochrome c oxidase copper chaperone n=1 Tax=Soboliphyme baturini TaxID=241478 RepID=A0A183J4Q6_9BILA|nr:unnamed protein product [Soboliphyme baturini]